MKPISEISNLQDCLHVLEVLELTGYTRGEEIPAADIDDALKKLQRRFHPDRVPDEVTKAKHNERFVAAGQAAAAVRSVDFSIVWNRSVADQEFFEAEAAQTAANQDLYNDGFKAGFESSDSQWEAPIDDSGATWVGGNGEQTGENVASVRQLFTDRPNDVSSVLRRIRNRVTSATGRAGLGMILTAAVSALFHLRFVGYNTVLAVGAGVVATAGLLLAVAGIAGREMNAVWSYDTKGFDAGYAYFRAALILGTAVTFKLATGGSLMSLSMVATLAAGAGILFAWSSLRRGTYAYDARLTVTLGYGVVTAAVGIVAFVFSLLAAFTSK